MAATSPSRGQRASGKDNKAEGEVEVLVGSEAEGSGQEPDTPKEEVNGVVVAESEEEVPPVVSHKLELLGGSSPRGQGQGGIEGLWYDGLM